MFGVLNINKPAGITSRDVVNHVQRRVRPHKVGHAGTLDPLATGVLVVCIGPATKLIEYVQQMPKRYVGEFLLGRQSETEDVEGEVELLPDPPVPTRGEVEEVLPRFIGTIEQRPPKHSALKIAGKRAYALARAGEAVDVQPRPVEIQHVELLGYDYPRFILDVTCGSGTYIRSLGRDIGQALDSAAVMQRLKRTAIGEFRIEQSQGLRELPNRGAIEEYLLPAQTALATLPQVTLTESELTEIAHGRFVQRADASTDAQELAALDQDGKLVAVLARRSGDAFRPARNFVGK